MRTIQYTVYQYNELSKQAQQVALSSLREEIAATRIEADSYYYRDTLENIEQIFRVKVYDWSVGDYKPYFRFHFVGIDEDMENDPRLLLRYLNNYILPCIDNKKRYYSKTARATRKSRILCYKYYDCCLTGCWTDSAVDNALDNINESAKNKLSARDFVDNLLSNFFNQWQKDYEYNATDECIEEEIDSAGYDFYESGKPCPTN